MRLLNLFWILRVCVKSKRKKTSILKTSILRKLLEHLSAKRCCTKLLGRARRRAASSSFEQFRATRFCSSSYLRITASLSFWLNKSAISRNKTKFSRGGDPPGREISLDLAKNTVSQKYRDAVNLKRFLKGFKEKRVVEKKHANFSGTVQVLADPRLSFAFRSWGVHPLRLGVVRFVLFPPLAVSLLFWVFGRWRSFWAGLFLVSGLYL